MITKIANSNETFYKEVTVPDEAEWATRLKDVEIAADASVTVIDGFKDELFNICDRGKTAMQLKTDCTVVIVFADDTINIFASTDVAEAVEFANEMIELLAN